MRHVEGRAKVSARVISALAAGSDARGSLPSSEDRAQRQDRLRGSQNRANAPPCGAIVFRSNGPPPAPANAHRKVAIRSASRHAITCTRWPRNWDGRSPCPKHRDADIRRQHRRHPSIDPTFSAPGGCACCTLRICATCAMCNMHHLQCATCAATGCGFRCHATNVRLLRLRHRAVIGCGVSSAIDRPVWGDEHEWRRLAHRGGAQQRLAGDIGKSNIGLQLGHAATRADKARSLIGIKRCRDAMIEYQISQLGMRERRCESRSGIDRI